MQRLIAGQNTGNKCLWVLSHKRRLLPTASLKVQGASWKEGHKDCETRKVKGTWVKQCLLDMAALLYSGHTAAVVA